MIAGRRRYLSRNRAGDAWRLDLDPTRPVSMARNGLHNRPSRGVGAASPAGDGPGSARKIR
eukprot:6706810-Pyramimonas_sp.AAC.1